MKFGAPFLLLFLVLTACSTEELTPPSSEKEIVTVNFGLTGDLTISKESPLKTFQTEYPDLFGIQLYDSQNKPYAFVVGNDLSQVTMELKKNESYRIQATYVKNGKDLLYYWDQSGEYGGPFETRNSSGTVLNKVYYSSVNKIFPGRVYLEPIEDEFWGIYHELDRYYGSALFVPTEENSTISLNLIRMVFGLKANLTLEESITDVDNIYFTIDNGQFPREYLIPTTEGFGQLEIPYLTLGIPECTGCATGLDFAMNEDYHENISISIGTIENPIRFYNGQITVQRNKMMVIDHVLKDQDTNSGGFEN